MNNEVKYAGKKGKMNSIFITNYEVGSTILKYEPGTGQYEEIPYENLPLQQKEQGFYVKHDDAIVGIYPSPEGPICFYNQQRFRMRDSAFSLDLKVGEEGNEFFIYWNNLEQCRICYKPTSYRAYDNWSAEDEDVDFFVWLKTNITQSEFYSFNTIKSKR